MCTAHASSPTCFHLPLVSGAAAASSSASRLSHLILRVVSMLTGLTWVAMNPKPSSVDALIAISYGKRTSFSIC